MYGILKYDHSDERFGVVFFPNDAVGFLNRWKLQLIINLDQITIKKISG